MSPTFYRHTATLGGLLALLVSANIALAAPDLVCDVTAETNGTTVTLTVTVTNNGQSDAINSLSPALGFPVETYFGFHSLAEMSDPPPAGADLVETFATLAIDASTVPVSKEIKSVGVGDHTAWCVTNWDWGVLGEPCADNIDCGGFCPEGSASCICHEQLGGSACAPGCDAENTDCPIASTGQLQCNVDLGVCTLGRPIAEETDFSNNSSSVSYTVTAPVTGPDLVVTKLTPVAKGASAFGFSVEVENIGNAPTLSGFDVEIYPQAPETPTFTSYGDIFCTVVSTLAAGQKQEVDCDSNWTYLSDGTYNAYAYVDLIENKAEGNVSELNEDNNAFGPVPVIVGSPDLTISQLTVDTSDDTNIKFDVTITNPGGKDATLVDVCLYKHLDAEPGVDDVPDSIKVSPKVTAGGTAQVSFDQLIVIGGTYTAWVSTDCKNKIEESNEDNNTTSQVYTVVGLENDIPEITKVTPLQDCGPAGICDCTVAELCQWDLTVVDEIGAPLQYRLIDSPLGMGVSKSGKVQYVPPLGSTTKEHKITVEVSDQFNAKTTTELVFSVSPVPKSFVGIVGELSSMLNGPDKSACRMTEVPGSGFAYVGSNYTVEFFNHKGKTTGALSLGPTLMVGIDYSVLDGKLGCHVQALPGGGFALLELTTNTVLIYGNDGTHLKTIQIPSLVGGALISEEFVVVDATTLAFLDPVAQKVIFVDWTTGTLNPNWGGNNKAEPDSDAGTPGVLDLYVTTAGTAMAVYDSYLWSNGSIVRVYNRFFSVRQLVDFDAGGSIVDKHPIGDLLPDDDQGDQPPWTLLSAPDGGIQFIDYEAARLCWYDGTFQPVSTFTVKNPQLPDSEAPLKGCVYMTAVKFELSVSNLHCGTLSGGGFTCHDMAKEQGFVLDSFAEYWSNCPVLDISPGSAQFGGVPTGSKKNISIGIANTGGGVLKITGKTLQSIDGTSAYSTPGWPQGQVFYLFPGEIMEDLLTYSPQTAGYHQGLVTYESNSCKTLSIPLEGYAGPHAEISPNPVSFVGVELGTHERSITVKSVGSDPLYISSLALTQSNSLFELIPNSPAAINLEPGQSTEYKIRFTATEPQIETALLEILTNDVAGAKHEVLIQASTAAELRIIPGGFNFGTVAIGDTRSQSVTLKNYGKTAIDFTESELIAPPGFSLDTSETASTLGPQESTKVTLKYSPTSKGSALGRVVLHQSDPALPNFDLLAIGGTGTHLPQGFTGSIALSGENGAFPSTTGVNETAIELSTGGFAFYAKQMNAIIVVGGNGLPDPWFGDDGVIRMVGPKGAFPNASGLGKTLVELTSGGFAMLSQTKLKIYCVGPDGKPNPYIGDGGILSLENTFSNIDSVGDTLAVLASHSFAVIDPQNDRVLVVDPFGIANQNVGDNGVISFSTNPVAGDGLATGIGYNLATTTLGGMVLGDTDTGRFYVLAKNGGYINQSTPNIVTNFNGTLTSFTTQPSNTFIYFDRDAKQVSAHIYPDLALDPSFGFAGQVNVGNLWPESNLGAGVIGLRSGTGGAVIDLDCDCLRFFSFGGSVMTLLPEYAAELPEQLDFSIVPVGQISSEQTVTIQNNGNFSLDLKLFFSDLQFRMTDGSVEVSIGPGQSLVLPIVFEPKAVGSHTGTLTILTNDPANPAPGTITLTGSTGPIFQLSPNIANLDYGNVKAGLSLSQSLTVKNAGADPLQIMNVKLSGNGFTLTTAPDDGTVLESGKSKLIVVKYAPASEGSYSGWLTIKHDDISQPTERIVLLSGLSGSHLKVSPTSISCAGVPLGKSTACGLIKVSNIGNQELTISDLQIDGTAFSTDSVNKKLLPGFAPLEIPISVTATNTGLTTGTLTIIHDGTGSLGATKVPLSASVNAMMTLQPPALDYGSISVGEAVDLSVTVSNKGIGGQVHMLAAATTGSPALSVVSVPVLPADLSNEGTQNVTVRCAPTSPGLHLGELIISTNVAGYGQLSAPISCIAGGWLTADPPALAFGAVTLGNDKIKTFVLYNEGTSTVTLGTPKFEGANAPQFSLSELPTTQLAPNEKMTIAVTFTAQLDKNYSATLQFMAENNVDSLLSVPMSATSGAVLTLVAGSDPLDFGNHSPGSTTIRTVMAVNTGSDQLEVTSINIQTTSGTNLPKTNQPFMLVDPTDQNFTLKAGESHPINIAFNPQSIGQYIYNLNVESDAGAKGLGILGKSGGLLYVAPNSLLFGETPLGSNKEQAIILANQSSGTALNLDYFVSGDVDQFALVDGQGQALSPGGVNLAPATTISDWRVRFSPTASGSFKTTFTFFSDMGVEGVSEQIVATGKSGARSRILYPPVSFHGFDAVDVGQSESRPIHIAAVGNAPLQILGSIIKGDTQAFDVQGLDSLPVDVPAGQIANITIQCTPPDAGTYSGVLQLSTDDPINPKISFNLWCTTPPALSVEPTSLEYGALLPLTSKSLSITITNPGEQVMILKDAYIVGGNASFKFDAPPPSDTAVPGGATYTIGVTFEPEEGQEYSAGLFIETSDSAAPQIQIPLKGVAGSRISVTPQVLNYCSAKGDAVVTITNKGASPLNIESAELGQESDASLTIQWPKDDADNELSPPFKLNPGESRKATVTLVQLGTKKVDRAKLIITSDDPNEAETTLRIVMGKGLLLEANFSGVSDVGAPGADSAFSDGSGIGIAATELCTGGFALTGSSPGRIYYTYPAGGGKALALDAWGSENGILDLGSVVADAGLNINLAADLGSILSSLDDGTLILVSPSSGAYVFVRNDGTIATERANGGVIRLNQLTNGPAVAGAIAVYGDGYVAVERRNKVLLGMTAAGELDTNFGVNGVVQLDTLSDVGHTVGERVLILDESIAISDGSNDSIMMLDATGALDKTWGDAGLFDLQLLQVDPPIVGLTAALAVHDGGFALVDAVTDRLIRIDGGGLLTKTNSVTQLAGPNGMFAGAAQTGTSLVVTSVAGAENADNKFAIPDIQLSDIFFVDDSGTILVNKAAAASLSICPIEIKLSKGQTQGDSQIINITNTGDTFLDLESIQLTNTQIDVDKLECSGEGCSAQTLNVAENTDFKIVWTANNPGVDGGADTPIYGCFEEKLTIDHNGINSPTQCLVKLQSYFKVEVAPVVNTFGSLSYTFPPQSQGSQFTKEFTIRNVGCQNMPIADKAIAVNVIPADFTHNTPGLPVDLGPGELYKFTVTCKPFEPGQHTTTLSITIDGKNHPVQLTCITGPLMDLDPSTLKWAGVDVGDAEFKDITITNLGGEALELNLSETTIVQDSDAYSMDLTQIKDVLGVGESQVLSVKFAPAEYRDYPATLNLSSNSISLDQTEGVVNLFGSSLAITELQPAVVDFGCVSPGESVNASVKISNQGAGSLSLELEETSLDGSIFEIVSYDEIKLVNIQPKNSSSIEFSCNPVSVGSFNAELTLKNDSIGATGEVKVPLLCNSGAKCELSTQVVDFGSIAWNAEPSTRTFALKNTGCAEMSATVFQPSVSDAVQEFKVVAPCEPVSDLDGCSFKVAPPSDANTPGETNIEITLDPSIQPVAHTLEHLVRVETDCLGQDGPLFVTLKAAISAPEDVGGDDAGTTTGTGTSSDDLGAEIQADGGGGDGLDSGSSDGGSGSGSDNGDDGGCGCKTTPSQPTPIPMGSLLIVMLMLVGIVRARRIKRS